MHKDFMDRLIIATAIEKNLQLLSLDSEFPKYKDFGLKTGLSLSLCKDVVEALNGKIASSSTFGEGSTFTISFGY